MHGGGHVAVGVALVEDPRLHVERLGGDAQRLGDLLEDLRARLAQPALDLAEVGVGDTGELRQLPKRHVGRGTLLADVVTEVAYVADFAHVQPGHVATLVGTANSCKRSANARAVTCVTALGARACGLGQTGLRIRPTRSKSSYDVRSRTVTSWPAARVVVRISTAMTRPCASIVTVTSTGRVAGSPAARAAAGASVPCTAVMPCEVARPVGRSPRRIS